jgi:hypothetical protein
MSTAATVLACAMLAQPRASKDDAAARAAHDRSKHLLDVYGAEVSGYTIYRDAASKEKLELRREPVYVWNNRVRYGGQYGAVYVWTDRGRAGAICTIFTSRARDNRDVSHEFHSLSLSVLDVHRSPGTNRWTPRAPGIQLATIPGAPPPAGSAPQRLTQMRDLAREFSARTRDKDGAEWELRLLPQPLYRYERTDSEIVDGAVFAFVTSAGTDPEAILVVEARKPIGGGEPAWHYAAARFTDMNLWVRHKGTVVFTADRVDFGTPEQNGHQRYHAFTDRLIPAIEARRP